ncbi:MAG TPA: hypothetical protein VMI75_10310 [Polyangiaceae bacterium]|nr:hypothetical protein [Polyangiaceae bacterium]
MSTEAETLERVVGYLLGKGLRPVALTVGSISVSFGPKEGAPKSLSQEQREIEALRQRARKLFGRDVPDDELKSMQGAL